MPCTSSIPVAMALLRQMHSETTFRALELNEEKLAAFLRRHFESDQFVFMNAGCIMLGAVAPAFFSDDMAANDILLYVRPESRGKGLGQKAVGQFIDWARQRGAKLITVGQSTGVNAQEFETVMGRTDLRKFGTVFGGV